MAGDAKAAAMTTKAKVEKRIMRRLPLTYVSAGVTFRPREQNHGAAPPLDSRAVGHSRAT